MTAITSPESLRAYAQTLVGHYQKILLHGDLGAGKTTFVQGFVEGLGLKRTDVTSPTYTYSNVYIHPDNKRMSVLHMDMYRLKSYEQTVELGLFDLIDQYDYVLIERPQREDEYADEHRYIVSLEKSDETVRELSERPWGKE